MGDYAGAEMEFTAAIAREPKSFEALLGRGVARESRREFAAAAEDYLEAVRLQPKNPEANLRLGLVLLTMKKTALGRRYLERTVELDPSGETGRQGAAAAGERHRRRKGRVQGLKVQSSNRESFDSGPISFRE